MSPTKSRMSSVRLASPTAGRPTVGRGEDPVGRMLACLEIHCRDEQTAIESLANLVAIAVIELAIAAKHGSGRVADCVGGSHVYLIVFACTKSCRRLTRAMVSDDTDHRADSTSIRVNSCFFSYLDLHPPFSYFLQLLSSARADYITRGQCHLPYRRHTGDSTGTWAL